MPVVVLATWTAKPGSEQLIRDIIAELGLASRAEPGNLYYQPFQDPGNPSVFRFFEIYVDDTAVTAHTESEHFQRLAFGKAIPELASRARERYTTIDA